MTRLVTEVNGFVFFTLKIRTMSTSTITTILLYIGLAMLGSITAFYNRVKNKLK